jgi:hypothetical protein
LIDLETWSIAKERHAKNKSEAERQRVNNYLLSVRTICGFCGNYVSGSTVLNKGKQYPYYRCNGAAHYDHKCKLPMFPAKLLDEAMWIWAKTIITQPDTLYEGLLLQKEEWKRQTAPLKERLIVVDDLINENQDQLGRLFDL